MQRPTLIWMGYNLFRLVAVVVISCALIAQFIAIASDLNEYSNAPDSAPSSSPVLIGEAKTSDSLQPGLSSASSTPSPRHLRSSTVAGVFRPSATYSAIPSSPLPSRSSSTFSVKTSTATSSTWERVLILNPAGETETLGDVAAVSTPTEPYITAGIELRALTGHQRRADAQTVPTTTVGYVGMSSVPNQPGGVFFLLVSRLMMAIVLGGLILVQVGYPETWLYRHLSWLGPQSPPLALAGLQLVIAVENLRVFQKTSILIPAWALLAIGFANLLISALLLCLKRNHSNPSRYFLSFSLSVRALYWTPASPFYRHLINRTTTGSEFSATQGIDESEDDTEKGRRPSHDTAYDLGDSDPEDDVVVIDPLPPIARKQIRRPDDRPVQQRELGELREEQDVRKGGYPTFARGGIDQPGRHVPAGIVEQSANGQLLRYTEEGRRSKKRQTHTIATPREEQQLSDPKRPTPETGKRHTALRQPPIRKRTLDSVWKNSRDTEQRGASSSALVDPAGRPSRVAVEHNSKRDIKAMAHGEVDARAVKANLASDERLSTHPISEQASSAARHTSHLLVPETRMQTTGPLTPIKEASQESRTTTPTGTPSMAAEPAEPVYDEPEPIEGRPAKSLIAAATDLGAIFPLPPERPTLAIDAASSAKANRQGSGDSIRKPSPPQDLPLLPLSSGSRPAAGAQVDQPSVLHHRELGDVPKTPTPPLGDGTLEVKETKSYGSSPLREAPMQAIPDAKSDTASRKSVVVPYADYFSAVTPTIVASDTSLPDAQAKSTAEPAKRTSYQVTIRRPQRTASDTRDLQEARPGSSLSRLRSSMAIPRSLSSRSIRSNRTAQGVRFDLSPISVSSGGSHSAASSPTRSLSPLSPPPRAGLRIPGTRLTVNLPKFSVPGTPKPRIRNSITSEEGTDLSEAGEWSEEETARPESVLSGRSATPAGGAEVGGHGPKRPGPQRSNTIDTLGGQYLDGGRQKQAQRHRHHSSMELA